MDDTVSASLEIEAYLDHLVPAGQVKAQLERLAAELGHLSPTLARGIPWRLGVYLHRVLQEDGVDVRLLLDCVCSLCWAKQEEARAALPEHLPALDWEECEVETLLDVWQEERARLNADALAQWLTWLLAGRIASRAFYLLPGEATKDFQAADEAFRQPETSSGLN